MTTILNMLLEITIYSAILYGAILLFKKVFHKHISAALNYAVWGLLVIRLLMPVTIDSGFSLIVIPEPEETSVVQSTVTDNTDAAEQAEGTITVQQPASQGTAYASPEIEKTAIGTVSEDSAAAATRWTMDWQTGLVALWAAGVAGSLIYLILFLNKLNRRIRRNRIPVPSSIHDLIEECKREMGIKKEIGVSMHDWLNSPALSAAFWPRLLLPARMLEMSPRQVEFGIRHELTHYKRKDHLMMMLLILLRCVYWFNPIVWIASPQIQADMETVCDIGVTSGLLKTERVRYINTMVDLSCKTNVRYVLGMGMCKGRKMVERRVRGVFMKKTTKPPVRMAAILLAGMMAMACFTTACQPTPESEVVIGKNDDTLESAIHTEALPGTTIEYDERWTEELQSADKEVKILIDAPVEVPNVTTASVVSVKPHYFNDIEVGAAVKELLGDQQLYQPTVDKSELEQYIISLRADIQSLKRDGTYSELHMGSGAGEPADDVEGSIEFYEWKLAKCEQEYNDAPDTPEKITEIKMTRSEETGALGFYAQDGQDIPATFDAYNNAESNTSLIEYRNWHGNVYSNTGEQQTKKPLTLNITVEEAQQTAIDFMRNLGMEDVSVLSVHGGTAGAEKDCYMITLERMIGGIPCHTITEHTGTMAFGVDGAEYREPWNPEEIEFMIDDTGIIGFKWENPSEIGETINSHVALLSYDEIKDIASAQLPRAFTKDDLVSRGYDDKTISINRITLGMMRIAKQDSTTEYYYLPVWDFIGVYGSGDDAKTSFLTLNAINGSIVDRGLGY